VTSQPPCVNSALGTALGAPPAAATPPAWDLPAQPSKHAAANRAPSQGATARSSEPGHSNPRAIAWRERSPTKIPASGANFRSPAPSTLQPTQPYNRDRSPPHCASLCRRTLAGKLQRHDIAVEAAFFQSLRGGATRAVYRDIIGVRTAPRGLRRQPGDNPAGEAEARRGGSGRRAGPRARRDQAALRLAAARV